MATPAIAMTHRADVYTANAGSGAFTNLEKEGLICRVLTTSGRGMDLPSRAENARARTIFWEPDFVMPEYAQLLYDSERWNVDPATIAKIEWLDGSIAYRRAIIVRAG